MITALILIGYFIIGVIVGKLVYNEFFDDIYQNRLDYYKGRGFTKNREDSAFADASNEFAPVGWGVAMGLFWPIFAPFAILGLAVWVLIKALGKILPKPQAQKQKELRDKEKAEAEKLRKATEELENNIGILRQANIDTKEIEDIVRSNRAKLKSQ